MNLPIFSCGTVGRRGALVLVQPDGSAGLIDFYFLGSKAPEPFRSEWPGRKGRNVYHKFVVTYFNLPFAAVFRGSNSFSPCGGNKNDDHLIMFEERGVAIAYEIEAMRVFDHLQFCNRMGLAFGPDGKRLAAAKAPRTLTLPKPTMISENRLGSSASTKPGRRPAGTASCSHVERRAAAALGDFPQLLPRGVPCR